MMFSPSSLIPIDTWFGLVELRVLWQTGLDPAKSATLLFSLTHVSAVRPSSDRSSYYDIGYHVDSMIHKITRITNTITISLRFGLRIQYSNITRSDCSPVSFIRHAYTEDIDYARCVRMHPCCHWFFHVLRLFRSSIWSDRRRLCWVSTLRKQSGLLVGGVRPAVTKQPMM